MRVEDITDEEEYNKVEDMTPFAVEVDTSILLAEVEALIHAMITMNPNCKANHR